ncbi:MAG: bifunctional GNAT family N-acetyltransferase/class I SAM-dependent methyltransferase [Clostridiales bacterium]|nr:bifunctional GNAT family N-acetyltransferase/class I SAM-dependent methyltransferase [Clostridiales bacterium]
MKTIIVTHRLTLREITQSDYPALAAIFQDASTMYAYEGVFSDAELQARIDWMLGSYRKHGYGHWAVVLKSSGELIGVAGIAWTEVEGTLVPEIGYHFHHAHWHRGYATEAALACKAYAFDKLGLKEIFSVVRSSNIAAKNVAIRNGMLIRQRIIRHYRGVDMPHFVLSATNPPHLLRMDDFFTTQAAAYDEYMLHNVDGFSQACAELARHIPSGTKTLLDLGCGTGLELAEIFRLHPDIRVTGIDLTQAMLDKLSEKYGDRQITLICASYIDYDFGVGQYDCIISLETMHHFTHAEKRALYANIRQALKPGGLYVEGDYMVETQAEEDRLFAEKEKLRVGQNIPDGELYHFDTPCTTENQIQLLIAAGFANAKAVWRRGSTSIVVAKKNFAESSA